jgi:hypothetical protein
VSHSISAWKYGHLALIAQSLLLGIVFTMYPENLFIGYMHGIEKLTTRMTEVALIVIRPNTPFVNPMETDSRPGNPIAIFGRPKSEHLLGCASSRKSQMKTPLLLLGLDSAYQIVSHDAKRIHGCKIVFQFHSVIYLFL